MDEPISNDNDRAVVGSKSFDDAHGQAAMLLVESLIHGLLARSIISVKDAIEIVENAAEIEAEIAAEDGQTLAGRQKQTIVTILSSIAASLRFDLEG